ncbi:hypothetical protein B5631_004559 [Salmonella enterica subsp. enterica serovar Woodinville]|nr:hypothetical protein [Salmonella enterica]EDS4810743.1 hypothetical protein [Salmonella enterica subsp. enterica serovar Woodinville]EBL6520643.1 hypothetical protein [Salmonella enterica]ECL7668253.1 hypothetical protein [Salmonella enterica]EEH6630287.1 hypothetical protein [Salmonella enterica]
MNNMDLEKLYHAAEQKKAEIMGDGQNYLLTLLKGLMVQHQEKDKPWYFVEDVQNQADDLKEEIFNNI